MALQDESPWTLKGDQCLRNVVAGGNRTGLTLAGSAADGGGTQAKGAFASASQAG